MRVYKHKTKRDGQWVPTSKWYGDIHLPQGRRVGLPLFEDERLSRDFARNLESLIGQVESGRGLDRPTRQWLDQLGSTFTRKFVRWGLISKSQAVAGAELSEHLRDYVSNLEHRGCDPTHCHNTKFRLEAILTECNIRTLADVQASKVEKFLSEKIRDKVFGERTANHYLSTVKAFLNWLIKDGRAESNPLQHVKRRTVTDIKRRRRALSADELTYLLDYMNHNGMQHRRLLYLVAVSTGLRSSELASLTKASIDFKNKTVTLQGAHTKNKDDAVLPLRDDVLAELREHVKTMQPQDRLFTMPYWPGVQIRQDMEDARAEYVAGGGKDDSFLATNEVDFHCLRHTFGSLLAASGVHPKQAMVLMRHKNINLTMSIYSHSYRGADAAAVASLPSLGTENKQKSKQA